MANSPGTSQKPHRKNLELYMKHQNMTAGLLLVIMIITGVLVNTSDCIAGNAPYSPGTAQNTDLSISPFKGPPTARVVITVFSDFQ
jgi:hypothetical protein